MSAARSAVKDRAQEAQRRIAARLAQLAEVSEDDQAVTHERGASGGPAPVAAPPATAPGRSPAAATAEVGDETAEIGPTMVARVEATTVDITLIDEDPAQHRKFSGPYSDQDPGAGVAELAATIRSRGLLQPIVIRPHDGRLRVIVGARRLRAFRYLAGQFPDEGWTHVPAIVWTGPVTRATIIAMQCIENDARKNVDPASRRRAYLDLRDELGGNARGSARKAMRMLGIGHTTWYRVTGEPADGQPDPTPAVAGKAATRISIGQLSRILAAYVERVPKLEADQATQLERALTELLDALRHRTPSPPSPE